MPVYVMNGVAGGLGGMWNRSGPGPAILCDNGW